MFYFPTVLVVVPTMLMAGTAVIMWRRSLHRKLPVFFSYLIYQCVWALILLLLSEKRSYAPTYWAGDLLSMGIGFAVIYELFESLLKDHEGIRETGLVLYRWSAVALMVMAVISCATAKGGEAPQLIAGVLTLERGVRIVQCGLLSFSFLFSYWLGLSWRSYAFGVALGFAVFVTADLIVAAARWHSGAIGQHMYFWLTPLSFDVAIIIWAGYVVQREPEASAQISLPDSQMARWNASVIQLLRRQWD